MKIIHIITIFENSFESFLKTSLLKKGIEKNLIQINIHKLNNFSDKKFGQVDDKAFGMHGQVISPEPLSKAINFIKNGKDLKVIYFSPSGELLNQEKLENYYEFLGDEFILICGHYEGIDSRIIEKYVDFEISIGEYILTGGELAAQIFIDSFSRFIPDFIGNPKSIEEESFSKKFGRKKEYPVYTRPQEFEGMKVPEILVSGNHSEIEKRKIKNLK